jgi:hypothetical protein
MANHQHLTEKHFLEQNSQNAAHIIKLYIKFAYGNIG